jgi:hypothetical protein
MRSTRLSAVAAGIAAAVLVTVQAALGASAAMHPELGARLAGMGEHGVVNIQSAAAKGRLCWTFDLPSTKGVTGASIHKGSKGPVYLKLGKKFKAKACRSAAHKTLRRLESHPGSYWLFVDTKGHPGDLRGRLVVGMVHM